MAQVLCAVGGTPSEASKALIALLIGSAPTAAKSPITTGAFNPVNAVAPPPIAPHQEVYQRLIRKYNKDRNKLLNYRSAGIYILQNEIANGAKFIVSEDVAYIIDGMTDAGPMRLSLNNTTFVTWLARRYGLSKRNIATGEVVDNLESMVRDSAMYKDRRRFASYDTKERALYISRYNGKVYRLDGESVNHDHRNGETVFFGDDEPKVKGIADMIFDDTGKAVSAVSVGPHGDLFDALVNDLQFTAGSKCGMSPEQQKLALTIFIFAVAFPDLIKTKPILIVRGAAGGGKTTVGKRIQKVLMGDYDPISIGREDEKEFGVQILRNPIALLDNVDGMIKWLQDAVCTYATGGGWSKRKLHTDDQVVYINPSSFLMVASKNPVTFMRSDIADRSIILTLDRRTSNTPDSLIYKKLDKERANLFGEWLYWLNQIVAEIKVSWDAYGTDANVARNRLGDWAAFSYVVGDVLGYPKEKITEMLTALQAEREAFVATDRIEIELLDKWLENETNVGRWLSPDLLKYELEQIAFTMSKKFTMRTSTLVSRFDDTGFVNRYEVEKEVLEDDNGLGKLTVAIRPRQTEEN